MTLQLRGEYEFWTHGVLVYKFHNIITTPVYEYILKSLNGDAPGSIDLSYFAFGDDDTAVAEGDTLLSHEVYRKAFTSKSWNGKYFVAICQLATSEANFSIKEVGVFSGGSTALDTGTLLSHAIKPIEKNDNITYNVVYRLTLEEKV
ncbi:MAG: hypothetical protein ACXQTR_01720 [Candidatus Methanospirareceae archaeon]